MVDYINVLQIGIGMIILIVCGYVLAKLDLVEYSDVVPINRFSFRFGFIPLAARSLTTKRLLDLDFTPFFVAALMSLSCSALLTVSFLAPVKNKFELFLTSSLPANYINYIITGLPVFNSIWDESENVLVSMMILANDLVTSPFFLACAGVYFVMRENEERRARGEGPQKFDSKILLSIIKRIVVSPILEGNVFGLIYAATSMPTPCIIKRIMKLLGDIIVPLCFFSVGVFLAGKSLISRPWYQFLLCLITRIFIGPAFAGLFAYALGMSNRGIRQCIIIGSQPTAVSCFIMCQDANIGSETASTMVFWTSIMCVPVVILWFAILDGLNIAVDDDE